jgi:hypothetical protein
VIWWYLRMRFTLWLLRAAGRVLRWLALAAVLAAAAPVTLVAAVGFAGAWLRGWPPARLARAAAWSLPMTAAYLAGHGLRAATWHAFALAPVRDWENAWDQASAGHVVTAFALTAPVAVPAGLAVAAGLWAWRIYAIETGLSGRTATAPVVFDVRLWRRASRAARGRVTAPGTFPLTTARGQIVMGATIRAVGHRWHPVTAISYRAMGRHQVIIGATGVGKTNLMMRTWAGWYAAALAAYYRGRAARPLLVVLDCKGGPDARVKAERTRRLLHAAGARRVAVWPDQASVSLWGLPPAGLAVTLFQLIETGTGSRRLLRRRHPGRDHPGGVRPARPPGKRRRVPRTPGPRLARQRLCRGLCPASGRGRRPPCPARCQPALPDPAVPPRPCPGRSRRPG